MPCVFRTSCEVKEVGSFGKVVGVEKMSVGGGLEEARKINRSIYYDASIIRSRRATPAPAPLPLPLALFLNLREHLLPRSRTSRSTKVPSSVSSLPSEGNCPPTERPLAATLFFPPAVAAFFIKEVERGPLALEAEGAALLVETIAEGRTEERAGERTASI